MIINWYGAKNVRLLKKLCNWIHSIKIKSSACLLNFPKLIKLQLVLFWGLGLLVPSYFYFFVPNIHIVHL